MRKFSTACLFLVVLFFNETIFGCVEEERQALLNFKRTLNDKSQRLSSWHKQSQDCCRWQGVQCDGATGNVVKLDLRFDLDMDMLNNYFRNISNQLEADEVDPSLLELKYLNHLDLSGNNFKRSSIPDFIGSMTTLKYLNLSVANFSGLVPHDLGNLSSLRVLDLQDMDPISLIIDDLTWISRLSSLQYLDMSRVDLGQQHNLPKVLNMLPSLLELHLSGCQLRSIQLPSEIPSLLSNMTSLRVLDLSENHFNSSIPMYLQNLKSLEDVKIGRNSFDGFDGLLSLLANQCGLKSLDISENYDEENISIPYGNLSGCTAYNLETLSLADNRFTGYLPDWLGQLEHLKYLDLSMNSFHGPIPALLGGLSALQILLLNSNGLTGAIPPSLGRLSALKVLDLSKNKLNGTIPISFGQLSNLKLLDVSFNYLEGVLSEDFFANLSMLEELRTSYNYFMMLKVRSDWIPRFQLKFLEMQSCKIESQFPQWLQTQKNLIELNLSNASISGTLPEWLHDMHFLKHLYLSDNHFSGPVPKFSSSLTYINLSNNSISGTLPQNIGSMVPFLETLLLGGNLINGSIPSSLCQIVSLQFLDISKNKLSGNLPHCLGELSDLWEMKFSSNRLTGIIPRSIGRLSNFLRFLNLNNNSFYGKLPLALKKCTSLGILDLGENGFSGSIPAWIGEMVNLRVMRLRNNMFKGNIPSQLCQLSNLQILDLADNNLTGIIPRCLNNLIGMSEPVVALDYSPWLDQSMRQVMKGNELEYSSVLKFLVNMDLSNNNLVGTIPEGLTLLFGLNGLNFSHNILTGSIPANIGNLKFLESLDFSNNQLSGTIPESMSAMTSLSSLNMSYNHLKGPIPTGNQIQTLDDPSIYAGNSGLCGAPLPTKCSGIERSQPPITTIDDGKYEEDDPELWFYMVIMSGYATGLWGVFGILLLKKNWRHALFGFVDQTKEKVLVAIAVRVARFNGR